MLIRRLITVLTGAAMASLSHAGSIIEMDTVTFDMGQQIPGTMQIYTEGAKTRIDMVTADVDDSSSMIFDGDKQEMLMVDHNRKEYILMTEEQMQAMASQVTSAMSQMDQALAALPPEQRALAEQMMKGRMPAQQPAKTPSKLERTGATSSVADHDCDVYEIQRDGRTEWEMCVTPWGEIDGARESVDAMMGVMDFMSAMRDAVGSSGGMGLLYEQDQMFEHIKSLSGFPIASKDYDEDGQLSGQSRLRSARTESIDNAMFLAPKDYSQQSMGSLE